MAGCCADEKAHGKGTAEEHVEDHARPSSSAQSPGCIGVGEEEVQCLFVAVLLIKNNFENYNVV